MRSCGHRSALTSAFDIDNNRFTLNYWVRGQPVIAKKVWESLIITSDDERLRRRGVTRLEEELI